LLLAGFAGWLGYIGYFGGPVYYDIAATRPAAPATRGLAVVLVSGDMGFKIGMGPRIAEHLTAAGIPVTGVSSLVHFRTRRSPAEIRAFIANAMRHARVTFGASRLILIGQSYGADMLHVGLATLPAAERRKIALVEFVVPTDTVYYQISPGELFEWRAPDADAMTTARQLDWVPLLCIRGVEERNSLCPRLHQPNVEHVVLPGGHALHWDSDALATPLLRKIMATLGPAPGR
jgi:type IV secretory pathway VirJ component